MNALLVSLLVATTLRPPLPRFIDRDAVVARYARECAGRAPTGACKSLADDVDRVFFYGLEQLDSLGEQVSPALLRVAISRPNPMLQAKALTMLRRQGLGAGDEALVAAALESPYLGVRRAAMEAAGSLQGRTVAKIESREYSRVFGHHEDGAMLFDRDVPPPASRLSAPLYPGATYFPLASGPRCAFFVTSDPPAKVIATLGRGKSALTAEQIKSAQKQAQAAPDPMVMMRMMQSGQDPRQMAAEMQKAAEAVGSSDWARFDHAPGVDEPRYIVAAEGSIMGRKVPTDIIAVFRDAILGKTAIVYNLREQHPLNAVGQDFSTYVQIQSKLASRPKVTGVDPTDDAAPVADDAPTPSWQPR